jgi:Tripartite tricarboxylate transporter family receptor
MNRATFPAKTVSRVDRLPRHICPAVQVLAGVNLIHVPYRGGVTGLPDLLAGQVNAAPQRDLRARGRGTGSRETCPNVWA